MKTKSIHAIVLILSLILVSQSFVFSQPINDDPCGAIVLTVSSGANCTPTNPQSWSGATASPNLANPGCGSYTTGDVWFTFSLDVSSDIYITTLAGAGAGAILDGGMAIYYADACDGTLLKINCDDDSGPGSMPQLQLSGQAPGLYFIRLWDYDDKTTANIGGICVASQPVISNVPNDFPCDAIELPLVSGDSCVPNNPLSWVGATNSPNIPAPSCDANIGGDIWFTFTLTDTVNVNISTLAGTGTDGITNGALALYKSDDCNGILTYVACNNNESTSLLMPRLQLISLLPATYYIRFWDVLDKNTANIGGICVSTTTSLIFPVINDEPCDAIELAVVEDTICTPQNPLVWSFATGSDNLPIPGCGSYADGDIWFTFTLNETSDIFITTAAGSGIGAVTDGAMELYKANSCDGPLFPVICDDDSGPGNMPQITETGLPAGIYYIRFWDYEDKISGNLGGICVARASSPSTQPNDACISAIPFPLIPNDGTCAEVTVNTIGATGEALLNCGAYSDDDVWYTFVVPAFTTKLSFSFKQNGMDVTEGLRIYKGDCGNVTGAGCFNQANGIIENLIPGNTYLARTYTTADDDGATYTFCLSIPASTSFDNPCGALELTVVEDSVCTPDNPISWELAGPTSGIPDPGCGSYATGDVWFRFVLDFKADISIKTAAGAGLNAISDGAMALYASNGCDQLSQITCNDDENSLLLMPGIQQYALDPGEFYIRFWDYYDNINGNIGGICVAAVPSISVLENDNCSGAFPFPDIPTDGSCASVQVNTALAVGGTDPHVGGFPDDDLWYSFTTPAGVTSLLFDIQTNSGNNQHVLCVYDACNVSTPNSCSYNNTDVISGLVENHTYYMRVYTYEQGVSSDFDVCLKLPPPPPANDLCINPQPFPLIPTDGSCASVSVLGQWATNTTLGCYDNENGDVWFSFKAPDNTTTLIADFIYPPDLYVNPGFQLYAGSCNNLIDLGCFYDDIFESLHITGLIPGQDYLLRAFTLNAQSYRNYELCLSVPTTPPPSNDECPNAIPFPVIPTDGSCASVIVNTQGATGDNGHTCYGIYDDDVWFTFTVPMGYTNLLAKRTIISGTPFDALAIYSGECDNLTLISCHAQGDSLLNGLIGGQTYFLRAYSEFANDTAHFEICIHVPSVTSQPNDECADAEAFPVIPTNGDWSYVSGSTLSASASGLPACNGTADDDVWYTFKTPNGYDQVVFSVDVQDAFNDYGLILEVYEGTCDSLTFLGCYNEGNTSTFSGLTGGHSYFLRVFSIEEHEYYNFTIGLSVPPAVTNDDCLHATVFPALPTDGSCITLHGNTALASGVNDPACQGVEDDDVWYQFTVPGDRTAIYFDITSYLGSGLDVAAFSGGCDNLVPVECFLLPYKDDVSLLQPGQTYYLRLFTNDYNVSADYDICLSAAPLPPANDDCNNAISITGAPGVFEDPGIQTLAGATPSDQQLCAQFYGSIYPFDVWYSFVTDADGGNAILTIDGTEGYLDFGYFNLAFQVFEGDCSDLTTIWCGGDYTNDESYSAHLEGLQGNTTYYFRVFASTTTGGYAPKEFQINAEGSAFSIINASETPPQPAGPNALWVSKVFPSPANAYVTVQFNTPEAGDYQLVIADAMGQILSKNTVPCKSGDNSKIIDLHQIPTGVYTVWLEDKRQRSLPLRFVKVE